MSQNVSGSFAGLVGGITSRERAPQSPALRAAGSFFPQILKQPLPSANDVLASRKRAHSGTPGGSVAADPAGAEDTLFATLRLQLGLPDHVFFTDRGYGSLGFFEQQAIDQTLIPGFFQEHNPLIRHTVLRRRQTLEEAGLLEKVGVEIHPCPDAPPSAYPGVGFSGLGLLTNHPFDLAYQAAESFTAALQQRTGAAGFMKTLLLQRICSSFASGRSTAEKMLRRESPGEEEEESKNVEALLSGLTAEENGHLCADGATRCPDNLRRTPTAFTPVTSPLGPSIDNTSRPGYLVSVTNRNVPE